MLHSVPAYTPPAIIQHLAPERTARTTTAPFAIATAPDSQETNTTASNLTPNPPENPENFAPNSSESTRMSETLLLTGSSTDDPPKSPLKSGTLSDSILSISSDRQNQIDFNDSSTPVNPPANLDLNQYSVTIDNSGIKLRSLLDDPSPVTSNTTSKLDLATTNSETERLLSQDAQMAAPTILPEEYWTFPVEIKVNNLNVANNVMVRGKKDEVEALDLQNWLLPYDAVVEALQLKTKVLPDNQIELRSPAISARIDLKKLQNDPELGLVFKVQELRTLFGMRVKFDAAANAIVLEVPQQHQPQSTPQTQTTVDTEGLPRISVGDVTLSAIEQRIDVTGTESTSPQYRGNIAAVGSILGGSWYIRANQADLFSRQTWSIAEARYQRQTDASDYIIGSQPSFWRSHSGGEYWGFTTIQRHGFVPQIQLRGGSDPRQRLQAAEMGHTISGRAEPGTLVRLVQGFSDRAISEILVDSSGIYRFENVRVNSQNPGTYRLLLYPQGRLTEQPEIRTATFSNLPGRIPAGASALVISGGGRRELSNSKSEAGGTDSNFTDFQGGVLGRWGVSNSLTVGAGVVYDQSLRGLGEIFFQPENVPLKVAVSALTGENESDWDINADVSFDPSSNFGIRFTRDRFSNKFDAHWEVFPGFTLIGSTSNNDGTAGGVQLAFSGKNFYTFARATYDTQHRLRWNVTQRLDRFELKSIGNEISTQSTLSYHFSQSSSAGHSLILGYDTRNKNGSDNLASISWHYTSQQHASDGSPLWDVQLGYGFGSRSSGIIAAVATTVIPGIRLQARYQGASVTSDESAFSLNLVSSFNFQRGVAPGDRRADYLRTQGGLVIQPFFDNNHNGKRDPGEKCHADAKLLVLNNQPIKSLKPEITGDRISMYLPPGTYRLDFNLEGLPVNWQAAEEAYAVDVVAGSYTPVLVPLVPSYTVSGTVTDEQGQPISGAIIEAIHPTSGERLFAIANHAGVYSLGNLQPGTHTLQVNGEEVSPNTIKLQGTAEALLELHLKPAS